MRPTVKRLLGLTALAGAGYAVWRAMESRRAASPVTWDAQPFPYPPQPRRLSTAAKPETSMRPADWSSPTTARARRAIRSRRRSTSGIFHVRRRRELRPHQRRPLLRVTRSRRVRRPPRVQDLNGRRPPSGAGPQGCSAEVDRLRVEDAVGGAQFGDHLGRDGGRRGQHHERLVARGPLAEVELLDVDPRRADDSWHA